jgi:hypothetical protein
MLGWSILTNMHKRTSIMNMGKLINLSLLKTSEQMGYIYCTVLQYFSSNSFVDVHILSILYVTS